MTQTLHPPARADLLDGAVNRPLLARAVTFALDSVRAGVVDTGSYNYPVLKAGLVGDLFWKQDEWITVGSTPPAITYGVDHGGGLPQNWCGTGCCIAGWIDLAGTFGGAAPKFADEYKAVPGSVKERAVTLLLGVDLIEYYSGGNQAMPGLPDGLYVDRVVSCVDDLFGGGNDLTDVVNCADELLRLYGQPPLSLDPEGTFR